MTNKIISTPQAVANYFIVKAHKEHRSITVMKLQKLLFISYGCTLAVLNVRLFDDQIEAWKHGPVIPAIYHEFKHLGSNPIVELAIEFDWDDPKKTPVLATDVSEVFDILDLVWDTYRMHSAGQLRDLTHKSGSPWAKVYVPGERHIQINDEDIRAYYRDFVGKIL